MIVGKSELNSGFGGGPKSYAFLCSGNVLYNINSLVDNADGWTYIDAHGINDKGWIAATGQKGSDTQAFLLHIVTTALEPDSLLILSPCLMFFIANRFRRRRGTLRHDRN